MKKLYAVIALLLLFCSPALAWTPPMWYIPSGELTADALVMTGSGFFGGIIIVTDGTNAVTVSIYDNTAGSGTKITPTMVFTTSATDRIQSVGLPFPASFNTGLYVDITTAGTCAYAIYYRD